LIAPFFAAIAFSLPKGQSESPGAAGDNKPPAVRQYGPVGLSRAFSVG
jgi:hypothetical protein